MTTGAHHAERRTLLDAALPYAGPVTDVVLVVAASLIIAAAAQVRIPLPFTPVPVTGQTFAVLLLGASLGTRRGAAAALLYLLAGWAGMPFFSGGVAGAFWTIASGGYILGFIPAAYLVGALAERGWDRGPWLIGAMLAGNAVIYVPGLIQLSILESAGLGHTLEIGLWPFVPGDMVKLILASLAMPSAWAAVERIRGRRRGLGANTGAG